MKKKQRTISKFIYLSFTVSLLSVRLLYGQEAYSVLERADSLFMQKQYTQSFDLYKDLFDKKNYTKSTLLKMAFIQEGLAHVAQSLYYLNLYYLVSGDNRASRKIERMASQNRLQGYELDGFMQIRYLLYRNYIKLTIVLGIFAIALLGALLYWKMKYRRTSYLIFVALLLCLILSFLHINFSKKINRGIVATDLAYLMKGPSAGASVVGVIGEGHQLQVAGKDDIWLRVQWMDQGVYIREHQVLLVEL